MYQEHENLVRFVNTYTAAESRYDRSAGKSRKRGITRVTQPHPQSKQKANNPYTNVQGEMYVSYNDQNRNTSNRKQSQQTHKRQCQNLLGRISQLQSQLVLLQKEKIQIERYYKEKINRPNPIPSAELVQSHYITCKEDIQKWNHQKQAYEEEINSLTVENNFLKINVGIHQQYILKLQNQRKLNNNRQEQAVQTEQLQDQKKEKKDSQVQCSQSVGLEEYQRLSDAMGRQTAQFESLIRMLQDRNYTLSHLNESLAIKNDELVVNIAKLQAFREETNQEYLRQKHRCQQLQTNEIELKKKFLNLQQEIRQYKDEITRKDHKLKQNQVQIHQLGKYRDQIKDLDLDNIKRQRERQREDARYLLKKLDEYQTTIQALKRQRQALMSDNNTLLGELERCQQQKMCCQQQKMQKTRLLDRIREQVLQLSEQYQQKTSLYAKTQQQKVELMEQLHAEKGLAQNIRNELQVVKRQYSTKISQLQRSYLQLQHKWSMDTEKIKRRQQQCQAKISMVKKDYDILYSKYLKYKNIAQLLQPKEKC